MKFIRKFPPLSSNISNRATETLKDTKFSLKISPSGLSAIHREFINFIIPQADIDELNQYDLTNKGYYLKVRVKNLGELSVTQGVNAAMDEANVIVDDQRKFYVDEKTGEYT